MNNSRLNVITPCDYKTCPAIISNDEAYGLIVVKSDGKSQSISCCLGPQFESLENRAIGDAQN